MFLRKKKKSIPGEETKNKVRKIVQEWLPVEDVQKNLIITRTSVVGVLRVEPLNIHLKSEGEKKRIIQAITGAFNSLTEPIQIICLSRPVDLDNYLRSLEAMIREQSSLFRRKILNQYLSYVRQLVASGEATEERFYILAAEKKGKYAVQDIRQKISDLKDAFERAGLEVSHCNDREITDLLFTFSNSEVSAFEREPDDLKNPVLFNVTL